MLKTPILLAALTAATPALAAETPWAISDDAAFQRRSTLQLGALGGVAAGVVLVGAAGLAPSGSVARAGIERTGFVTIGASVLLAGINLPTLTAYGWRKERYAWSHPFALVGVAPMLLVSGCALGLGLTDTSPDGVVLGYVIGIVLGLAGSAVTHLPGSIGPLLMAIDQPAQLGLRLLPPAHPWEAGGPVVRKPVPAATLTTHW